MVKKAEAILAVTASLLWGLSFPAIKAGLENVSPILLGALRYIIAMPLFILLSLAFHRGKSFCVTTNLPYRWIEDLSLHYNHETFEKINTVEG
ncbi:MAG: EamA family transporter [Candidatus Thermoplasmatota archaeon]|nr:EamA family transporter [Candidatus Thermoplasmatota archaeon]